jgi:hypothetical protein
LVRPLRGPSPRWEGWRPRRSATNPIIRDRITDRTLQSPIPDVAWTGRAFITSCHAGNVTEFLVNGQLYRWTEPRPCSIDDINETGIILVDAAPNGRSAGGQHPTT